MNSRPTPSRLLYRKLSQRVSLLVFVGAIFTFCATRTHSADSPAKPETPPAATPDDQNEIFSGQVVMLQAALKKRGIKSKDEIKDQIVLETKSGELWPIVPDWRGRAFYQDERLRNRPVDLVCKRTPGVPWLQVLSIYTFDEEGERQITDYWCDICSIPMYEIKPCDCCQGDIRLRFQPQDLPDYLQTDEGQKPQSGAN